MKPLTTCFPIFLLASIVAPVHADMQGLWSTHLSNGMRVVLLEDHSSALAASVVCVRAGSRSENLQNNGLSHLLEHLLFDGTETYSRESLSKSVTSQGGYFNAFTREDFVAFELVMPSASFLSGLRIQADQLLNSVIKPEELDKERKVVCEEIAKDLNSAQSAASAELMSVLFGSQGYGLPVIGNYGTVESIQREDILRFYHSRYVPNRMTFVAVGDFNPSEVLQAVKSIYEPVPAGLDPMNLEAVPAFPSNGLHRTKVMPVDMPYFLMTLRALPLNHPESQNLDAAVSLWADGEVSPLQIALTKSNPPLAVQASAWIEHHDGFSLLNIGVIPSTDLAQTGLLPEKLSHQLVEAIEQSWGSFWDNSPSTAQIHRIKMNAISDFQFAREKFHHLARDIAFYDTLNAMNHFVDFPSLANQLSPRSVVAAAATISFSEAISILITQGKSEDSNIQVPQTGFQPALKTLPNGLKVIAWSDTNAPLMAFHLLVPTDGIPIPGVPRMVSALLDKGTKSKSAAELEDALADHGIRIKLEASPWMPFDNYYQSQEYAYIRMECLAGESEPALKLLKEMAFESILPDDAFMSAKMRLNALSGRRQQQPQEISRDLLDAMIFPGSVYDAPLIPSPAQLNDITIDAVREYYARAFQPENCLLSITGDLPQNEIFRLAESVLGDLKGSTITRQRTALRPAKPARKTIRLEAEQASIRLALPLYISKEQLPMAEIAAELLSDSMKQLIREKRGMAYRLGAGVSIKGGLPILEMSAGTRNTNLPTVLEDLNQIIRDFRQLKPDTKAVQSAINSISGHLARYRQRRINRCYYLAFQELCGNGFMFDLEYPKLLSSVTSKQMVDFLKFHIGNPDQWYWAIVSDDSQK